jgi:ABC-2 type transport system permease protein
MAFVAYFPALYVLDKPDPLGLPRAFQFASPLVALFAAVAAAGAWRIAVRHYRSAGG